MKKSNTIYCSFCGKSQHELKHLIAGPACFICDECVDICTEIVLLKRRDNAEFAHDMLVGDDQSRVG